MRQDTDDATLARYLSGELSPAEAAAVERWIAEDPAHAERVALLREVWNRPPSPEFDRDDVVWTRLSTQLEPPLPGPFLVRDPEPRPWYRRWAPAARSRRRFPASGPRLAAAAIVVLFIGAVTFLQLQRAAAPIAIEEITTARGERVTIDLPDGSRAILAAESRLRYAASVKHWQDGDEARELYLEGQAYFEVQHDSTRSFRVRTPTGVVEDLGTEFVVAAYPETRGTVVAVVSGSVALYRPPMDTASAAAKGTMPNPNAVAGAGQSGSAQPLLTLVRGDVARLDAAGRAVMTRDVNLAPYVAWTDWHLVFDATPMREVVATLARWYDLDITFADSALSERRLTASFQYEPLSQILELIARSLNVPVERDGRSVVFGTDPTEPR